MQLEQLCRSDCLRGVLQDIQGYTSVQLIAGQLFMDLAEVTTVQRNRHLSLFDGHAAEQPCLRQRNCHRESWHLTMEPAVRPYSTCRRHHGNGEISILVTDT